MPTHTSVSYPKAALRHFEDATLLEAQGRNPNAGQLYGFAAECGIKSLMPFNSQKERVDGPLGNKHIHQIINQLSQVQTAYQSRSCAHYLSMIPNINNFHDWDTTHRYFDESCLPPSLPCWRDAAKEVCLMLDQATQDRMVL